MADKKITEDPAASVPLTGAEILPLVQTLTNKRVTVEELLNSDVVVDGGEY